MRSIYNLAMPPCLCSGAARSGRWCAQGGRGQPETEIRPTIQSETSCGASPEEYAVTGSRAGGAGGPLIGDAPDAMRNVLVYRIQCCVDAGVARAQCTTRSVGCWDDHSQRTRRARLLGCADAVAQYEFGNYSLCRLQW